MAKSELEQNLLDLTPDQFAEATRAFDSAKAVRQAPNDPEFRRKVANMSQQELQKFFD